MASGIRVKISDAGARAVLTSAGVAADIAARGARVAAAACRMASPDDMDNDPFMCSSEADGTRARARVFAASPHGVRNNNKYNTLLKSLDEGR